MLKDRNKPMPAPSISRDLILFWVFALGIAAGVLYLVPLSETWGNLFTMLCAVLAGIYYTRHIRSRKDKPGCTDSVNDRKEAKGKC